MSGPIERRVLDNGLTVIAERRGLGPVVFSGVVYRVGSRDERPGITGISHLLEHMMFKGTEKYGKGDVAAIVERNGGDLNAFTSEDVTMYYEVFARDRWPLALEIEAERMENLRIDPEELESERQVVLEERVMYQDIPAVELNEELTAAMLRESPYRWPIIGWEADIEGITRDDLVEHYRRYYAPDNGALVVVGDITPDEVFREAEKHFGRIPTGPGVTRRIPQEPPLRGATRFDLARATNLPHLQLMFRAPEIGTAESESLALVASVLSGTRTSRLDLALLETNKAGDVSVQYHAKQDPSTFTIFVEGHPGVSLDEVESIVWNELERLAKDGPDDEERTRALDSAESDHVISQQSPSNRGFTLGWHEAHGDLAYADTILPRLQERTREEMLDVARRTFRRDACGVARIVPVGNGAGGGNGGGNGSVAGHGLAVAAHAPSLHGVFSPRRRFRTGLQAAPDLQRRRLANGLSVVLLPDRTDPVVSISMLFTGGGILDPVGREGLSKLAADTLERGPRGVPFLEFNRRFERLGSELSFETGSEMVHAGVTLLSRHAPAGLGLLVDLLEDPGLRDEDFEIVRELARNDLEARVDDLDDVAEDLFFATVAGEHPYARLGHGRLEGVTAATADDVRRQVPELFRLDQAHLAIVGDFDDAAISPLLDRLGAAAVPGRSPAAIPELPLARVDATRVATRPEKAQAKIWWGGPGLSADDPDRYAAIAFNHVLGGSAIRSRLGDTIRDEQGLAYSVWSRNYERRQGGFFVVSMGTRPENVAKAVSSIRTEVHKLAEQGPTESELNDARDYLTGSFPLRFTTYGRLARFWVRASFHDWPSDFLLAYPERIRALSAADLIRAGQRLAGATGTLAVAGPVNEDLSPCEAADAE
ncbi:MAG: pitrilysin family protein [bacterium]